MTRTTPSSFDLYLLNLDNSLYTNYLKSGDFFSKYFRFEIFVSSLTPNSLRCLIFYPYKFVGKIVVQLI